MWKLFTLTFLCLFLTTSCDDDKSGDVKTTQVVAAATATGSNSDVNSAAAIAKITTVETEESSDPSSGPGYPDDKSADVKTTQVVAAAAATVRKSNSDDGSNYDGYGFEDYEDDEDCNIEERDEDYDCSSALHRVKLAIIKISCIRNNYFIENNKLNYNNYCDITHSQGKEGHVGSPLATWYVLTMIDQYANNKTSRGDKETCLSGFLDIKNKDEARCVMIKIRRLYKRFFKGFFYYSANLMADYKYGFEELFKSDVIEYLDGKAVNSNYSRPLICARKINKIAAVKTGNKVQDLVSKQKASTVFNADQRVIVVSGTYLKPVLRMSFNTANKTTGIYYGLKEPTLTTFLHQDVICKSTESRLLDSRLIQIRLENENTYWLIIFSNTRCGLQPMVAKLTSEPQILLDEMKRLKDTIMHLTVPSYTSFTDVENVVPALQSTCEINSLFDDTKCQMIDSCGRSLNRSITYIHEKSTAMWSPIGAKPYKKASAKDCSECGEPVHVNINYPAVFFYMVDDVIVESVIGEVEKVEPSTN